LRQARAGHHHDFRCAFLGYSGSGERHDARRRDTNEQAGAQVFLISGLVHDDPLRSNLTFAAAGLAALMRLQAVALHEKGDNGHSPIPTVGQLAAKVEEPFSLGQKGIGIAMTFMPSMCLSCIYDSRWTHPTKYEDD
jgi:hypothetical protein